MVVCAMASNHRQECEERHRIQVSKSKCYGGAPPGDSRERSLGRGRAGPDVGAPSGHNLFFDFFFQVLFVRLYTTFNEFSVGL